MPNQKFKIDITARDKTAEALKSATSGFEKFAKGTPLEKISRGFETLREKGHAVGGFGKNLQSLGVNASISAGGLGEAAGGMESLAAMAGVAGLATAGVGAALVGAGTAAFKAEEHVSKLGASAAFLSQIIGMSAQQLQQYEIAGKRFGITADAMGGALQNVGNTLQNAMNGRDDGAQRLLTQLRVRVKYLANGSVDAAAGMEDLANALANGAHAAGMNNAQTRQLVNSTFGLASVQAYLVQSSKDRAAALDHATKSGAIQSDQQLAQSKAFQASIADAHDEWDGYMNALSSNVVIPWLQPTIDALAGISSGVKDILNTSVGARAGRAALDLAEGNPVGLFNDLFGKDTPMHKAAAGLPKSATAGVEAAHGGPTKATPKDEDALARAIYTEAGGESVQGQAAVAHVILNRARAGYGGAKSIADVVNAPGQFEGMTSGRRNISTSDPRYQHALQVARDVLAGKIKDPTGGADHFLNPQLQAQLGRRQPSWASGESQRIGNHVFYTKGQTETAANDQSGARTIPTSTVSTVNGSVHVDINLRGAPPGTIVTAAAKGAGVTSTARIAPTMTGSA